MSITLEQFNHLPTARARALLKNCVHIPQWIDTLVAHRPYLDLATLHLISQQHSSQWQWSMVKAALDQHPRIGQKQAVSPLSAKEQQFSHNEQGHLRLNDSHVQALFEGNIAYEQRFGFIFLIRASGRTPTEILAELQRRLHNTDNQEQLEVIEQMAQITQLRLAQEIVA